MQWSRNMLSHIAGRVLMFVLRRLHRHDLRDSNQLVLAESLSKQRQLHHVCAKSNHMRLSNTMDRRLLHSVHVIV